MGSICDAADINRYMRSIEGRKEMDDMREALVGKTISSVNFEGTIDTVLAELTLSDGHTYTFAYTNVDCIRDEYPKMLEREYYIDHPEGRQVDYAEQHGECDTDSN